MSNTVLTSELNIVSVGTGNTSKRRYIKAIKREKIKTTSFSSSDFLTCISGEVKKRGLKRERTQRGITRQKKRLQRKT